MADDSSADTGGHMADTASQPSSLVFLLKQATRDYSHLKGRDHNVGCIWTEEEMDALASLYESGKSVKDITKLFPHRSYQAITTRLWTMRRHGELDPVQNKETNYADNYYSRVKHMLARGYEAKEIAEEVGVEYATLRGWLGYWRLRGDLPPVRVKWTEEKKRRVLALRDAGYSRQKIADKMRVSATTVGGMIDRMIRSGEAKRIPKPVRKKPCD